MKFKFNKPDPEKLKAAQEFGRRTQEVGQAITKFGMQMMGAGLLLGFVMLLFYLIL
jgi:hypothetical protein